MEIGAERSPTRLSCEVAATEVKGCTGFARTDMAIGVQSVCNALHRWSERCEAPAR